ncbi:hypothetical protein [Acidovorax sp. Leaf78]|uniref:hypothetical protein n=1 Tax=unclassified Acidovorax TaxID=2684926 RepID=UPI0006F3F245|nr:hypothetical protein [Acidovorax sp. Leaf78]KQO21085.1 hypothetical protein ASF16_24920 [Acidovorax sp. Leaf78]
MKHQRPRAVGVLWRAAAAAAVLLMAGCSSLDVPRADNYPATDQKKARAVHHWDVLADDVASRIASKISAWPAGEYPIYVSTIAGDTSFNNGFRKLLITRLLDRGVTLSTQPTAVTLTFETQLVQHEARVVSKGPMPWTRLALGVGVARDWHLYHQSAGSMLGGIVALGAITDLTQYAISGAAAGGPTRTEVLITTSLESADRYLARTADVYYIEQDDSVLYKAKAPEPPPPMPPPPTPMKTWQVVAP